jgi:hypothetical protein
MLLEVLSAEQGRISLVARGARRKIRGGSGSALLQPFVPLLLSFSGRTELKNLNASEAAGRPLPLLGERLFSGLYLNELLVRLLHRHDPHPQLFAAYGSTLDDVPELTEDLTPKLGGRALVPVGSHAVRELILEHKPLLGLHGHIHEGKGAVRVGKTLCINPGSMYEQGRLLGAVVNLVRGKIKTYILTTG